MKRDWYVTSRVCVRADSKEEALEIAERNDLPAAHYRVTSQASKDVAAIAAVGAFFPMWTLLEWAVHAPNIPRILLGLA